ncbi:MAG: DNA primase [Patescibacteria group bacterium]|jgi:DNA primase
MQNPVEEIKAKLDVADIISTYITLNSTGSNLKARCPFHNEKTASFMVSREKQIWHCFGCGKGGDIFTFIQEYEGLSFSEAIKLLAEKANVSLAGYQSLPKENFNLLFEINHLIAEKYQSNLFDKNETSAKVLDYLLSRGLTTDSIKKWGLGLSTESWDEALQYLKAKKFSDTDIFQAGISVKKKDGSGYVDRFRKRLMFPIFDTAGRVVAFTSRTLQGIVYHDEDFGGKYINSPQTNIYDKSKILYGWHLAKATIKQKNYLIIVEGNLDAILSQQAGTTNTVAVSGTALTIDHLKLIKRYTNNVILAFDGDTAGSNAALRSITLAWAQEMNMKILVLPQNQDPADIVKSDKNLWLKLVRDSIQVMDYYFQRILSGVDLNRADHKKIAVQKLLPIIKYLKSAVEQSHYLQLLADKLHLPLDILQSDLKQVSSFLENVRPEKKVIAIKKPSVSFLSEELLGIVFFRNNYLERLVNELEPEMMEADLLDLYRKVIIYYTKQHNLDNFIDWPELEVEAKQQYIRLLMSAEQNMADLSGQELDSNFNVSLERLKSNRFQERRQLLIEQLRQAELKNDTITQDQITHKINLLNKEITKLQR